MMDNKFFLNIKTYLIVFLFSSIVYFVKSANLTNNKIGILNTKYDCKSNNHYFYNQIRFIIAQYVVEPSEREYLCICDINKNTFTYINDQILKIDFFNGEIESENIYDYTVLIHFNLYINNDNISYYDNNKAKEIEQNFFLTERITNDPSSDNILRFCYFNLKKIVENEFNENVYKFDIIIDLINNSKNSNSSKIYNHIYFVNYIPIYIYNKNIRLDLLFPYTYNTKYYVYYEIKKQDFNRTVLFNYKELICSELKAYYLESSTEFKSLNNAVFINTSFHRNKKIFRDFKELEIEKNSETKLIIFEFYISVNINQFNYCKAIFTLDEFKKTSIINEADSSNDKYSLDIKDTNIFQDSLNQYFNLFALNNSNIKEITFNLDIYYQFSIHIEILDSNYYNKLTINYYKVGDSNNNITNIIVNHNYFNVDSNIDLYLEASSYVFKIKLNDDNIYNNVYFIFKLNKKLIFNKNVIHFYSLKDENEIIHDTKLNKINNYLIYYIEISNLISQDMEVYEIYTKKTNNIDNNLNVNFDLIIAESNNFSYNYQLFNNNTNLKLNKCIHDFVKYKNNKIYISNFIYRAIKYYNNKKLYLMINIKLNDRNTKISEDTTLSINKDYCNILSDNYIFDMKLTTNCLHFKFDKILNENKDYNTLLISMHMSSYIFDNRCLLQLEYLNNKLNVYKNSVDNKQYKQLLKTRSNNFLFIDKFDSLEKYYYIIDINDNNYNFSNLYAYIDCNLNNIYNKDSYKYLLSYKLLNINDNNNNNNNNNDNNNDNNYKNLFLHDIESNKITVTSNEISNTLQLSWYPIYKDNSNNNRFIYYIYYTELNLINNSLYDLIINNSYYLVDVTEETSSKFLISNYDKNKLFNIYIKAIDKLTSFSYLINTNMFFSKCSNSEIEKNNKIIIDKDNLPSICFDFQYSNYYYLNIYTELIINNKSYKFKNSNNENEQTKIIYSNSNKDYYIDNLIKENSNLSHFYKIEDINNSKHAYIYNNKKYFYSILYYNLFTDKLIVNMQSNSKFKISYFDIKNVKEFQSFKTNKNNMYIGFKFNSPDIFKYFFNLNVLYDNKTNINYIYLIEKIILSDELILKLEEDKYFEDIINFDEIIKEYKKGFRSKIYSNTNSNVFYIYVIFNESKLNEQLIKKNGNKDITLEYDFKLFSFEFSLEKINDYIIDDGYNIHNIEAYYRYNNNLLINPVVQYSNYLIDISIKNIEYIELDITSSKIISERDIKVSLLESDAFINSIYQSNRIKYKSSKLNDINDYFTFSLISYDELFWYYRFVFVNNLEDSNLLIEIINNSYNIDTINNTKDYYVITTQSLVNKLLNNDKYFLLNYNIDNLPVYSKLFFYVNTFYDSSSNNIVAFIIPENFAYIYNDYYNVKISYKYVFDHNNAKIIDNYSIGDVSKNSHIKNSSNFLYMNKDYSVIIDIAKNNLSDYWKMRDFIIELEFKKSLNHDKNNLSNNIKVQLHISHNDYVFKSIYSNKLISIELLPYSTENLLIYFKKAPKDFESDSFNYHNKNSKFVFNLNSVDLYNKNDNFKINFKYKLLLIDDISKLNSISSTFSNDDNNGFINIGDNLYFTLNLEEIINNIVVIKLTNTNELFVGEITIAQIDLINLYAPFMYYKNYDKSYPVDLLDKNNLKSFYTNNNLETIRFDSNQYILKIKFLLLDNDENQKYNSSNCCYFIIENNNMTQRNISKELIFKKDKNNYNINLYAKELFLKDNNNSDIFRFRVLNYEEYDLYINNKYLDTSIKVNSNLILYFNYYKELANNNNYDLVIKDTTKVINNELYYKCTSNFKNKTCKINSYLKIDKKSETKIQFSCYNYDKSTNSMNSVLFDLSFFFIAIDYNYNLKRYENYAYYSPFTNNHYSNSIYNAYNYITLVPSISVIQILSFDININLIKSNSSDKSKYYCKVKKINISKIIEFKKSLNNYKLLSKISPNDYLHFELDILESNKLIISYFFKTNITSLDNSKIDYNKNNCVINSSNLSRSKLPKYKFNGRNIIYFHVINAVDIINFDILCFNENEDLLILAAHFKDNDDKNIENYYFNFNSLLINNSNNLLYKTYIYYKNYDKFLKINNVKTIYEIDKNNKDSKTTSINNNKLFNKFNLEIKYYVVIMPLELKYLLNIYNFVNNYLTLENLKKTYANVKGINNVDTKIITDSNNEIDFLLDYETDYVVSIIGYSEIFNYYFQYKYTEYKYPRPKDTILRSSIISSIVFFTLIVLIISYYIISICYFKLKKAREGYRIRKKLKLENKEYLLDYTRIKKIKFNRSKYSLKDIE